MLKVEGLTKRYGGVEVNAGLTFSVADGEVAAVLGGNGSGKTTLVHQIAGLTKPSSGSIRLDGEDLGTDPRSARRLCALQPQGHVPLTGLTPRRAVEIAAGLRGLSPPEARRRAEWLGRALGLETWMDRRVRAVHLTQDALSAGMRRLVAFCMAIAAPSRALLLDEPTNDVDPVRRARLWGLVRDVAAAGSSVVVVTHHLSEAARFIDHVLLMDRGRILVEGQPEVLRARYCSEYVLDVVTATPDAPVEPPEVGGFVSRHARGVLIDVAEDRVAQALEWAHLEQEAQRLVHYSLRPSTLDDAYGRIVAAGGLV